MANRDNVQIRTVVESGAWEAITRAAALLIRKWQAEKTNGGNEFETLRSLHVMQGKVEGVTEFLSELEKPAINQSKYDAD